MNVFKKCEKNFENLGFRTVLECESSLLAKEGRGKWKKWALGRTQNKSNNLFVKCGKGAYKKMGYKRFQSCLQGEKGKK